MKKLYFYTTEGCHLCEIAAGMLESVTSRTPCDIQWIDIATSDSLIETYGTQIPVLAVSDQSQQQLNWPFTDHELHEWLALAYSV